MCEILETRGHFYPETLALHLPIDILRKYMFEGYSIAAEYFNNDSKKKKLGVKLEKPL